jgi:hypothetical protein
MGHEWAHAELGGESHGGAVMRLGRRHAGVVMLRGDLTQDVKGPRLVAAFCVLTGVLEGTLGHRRGLIPLPGHEPRLAQVGQTARLLHQHALRGALGQDLLQEGKGLVYAPGPRVGGAQVRQNQEGKARDAPDPRKIVGVLEGRDRRVEVALEQVNPSHSAARHREVERLAGRLRDPERFVAVMGRFGKPPQLGEAPRDPGVGIDGAQAHHARIVAERVLFEEVEGPSQELDSPPVVPSPVMDHAQVHGRRALKLLVAEGFGHPDVPLAQLPGPLEVAEPPETVAQVDGDLEKSPLVAEALRQGLGAAEMIEQPWVLGEGRERASELEPDVDHPLVALAGRGKALEGLEHLLKVGGGFPVGRSSEGLDARLTEIVDGLLHLSPRTA